MSNQERDEFYVGYLPQAPSHLARRLRVVIVSLFVLVIAVAALLASRQQPLGEGRFEFGVDRNFDGVIREEPYPLLIASDRTYLLSDFGKWGSADSVAGRNGMPTRLVGTLVERDGRAMIEVHQVLEIPAGEQREFRFESGVGESLGRQQFEGEIIDSKCYLGVMKPGRDKSHRGCAVRCISGGIPPLLLVVAPDGRTRELLLADVDGGMVNEAVLPFVAEPVEVAGELLKRDGVEILLIDPAEIRRVKR